MHANVAKRAKKKLKQANKQKQFFSPQLVSEAAGSKTEGVSLLGNVDSAEACRALVLLQRTRLPAAHANVPHHTPRAPGVKAL